MDFTLYSLTGIFGAALYLGAYGALQIGVLRGSSILYTVLNLAAALAVLISLGEAFNLSSAIIQTSWVVLSIIGLGRRAVLHYMAQFNPEEKGLLAGHFPALPPTQARRLLQLGSWRDLPAGAVLARQGEPVGALIYLNSGAARVTAHGRVVARLGPGDLIGEFTVMHGGAATATVETTDATRVFSLPRKKLLREMSSDHEFALLMGNALQIEAQRKIESANIWMQAVQDTVSAEKP